MITDYIHIYITKGGCDRLVILLIDGNVCLMLVWLP